VSRPNRHFDYTLRVNQLNVWQRKYEIDITNSESFSVDRKLEILSSHRCLKCHCTQNGHLGYYLPPPLYS